MSIAKIKRTRRLELLNLQSHIEQVNCSICTHKKCDGCPFYKKLNEIGNELLQTSRAERTYKPMKDEDDKRDYKILKNLISLEIYNDYKNKGLNDKRICETLGINISSFRKWKSREGLVKTKETRNNN